MTTKSRSERIFGRLKWFLAAGALLWLAFIAPFASIFALLGGEAFYAWWAGSLLILPWPFLLLLGVFRTKNTVYRWWVFQYLGISSICFSASLIGILLSTILPAVLAGKIALLMCVLLCAFGVYSACQIHVEEIVIETERIKKNVKLVHISDVHIGSRRPAYLDRLLKLVDAQQPDILAITGDLIDQNVSPEDLKPLSERTYPVFYSSGNHERYVNYRQALDNIARQGVTVLNDSEASCLGLRMLGIADRERVSDAEHALDKLQGSDISGVIPFTVLLYHQPDLWECAKRHRIDLTLSGHTHKGQIWPFGLLVRTRYRYVAGLFKSASSHFFVSQGAGTWGPTMRLGTRCEITVLHLKEGVE